MRNIPEAVAKIDWIIENIDHPDAEVRRDAAAGAQYALLGHPAPEKAAELLGKVAGRLELKLNGHAIPVEPDEYVRERCANAVEMAASSGRNVSALIPLLKLSRDRDPHEWVRDMARDAIRYIEGMRHSLPETFTTRSIPEAFKASYKREQPSPPPKHPAAAEGKIVTA